MTHSISHLKMAAITNETWAFGPLSDLHHLRYVLPI